MITTIILSWNIFINLEKRRDKASHFGTFRISLSDASTIVSQNDLYRKGAISEERIFRYF
jgi:hypothetical protein